MVIKYLQLKNNVSKSKNWQPGRPVISIQTIVTDFFFKLLEKWVKEGKESEGHKEEKIA